MPSSDETTRKRAYELLSEGVRLINAKRYGEAIDALNEANRLLPDDPDILMTLGGALIMAGKWNQAEALLQRAVEKHPENARLWLNLAAAILGRLELSPDTARTGPSRRIKKPSSWTRSRPAPTTTWGSSTPNARTGTRPSAGSRTPFGRTPRTRTPAGGWRERKQRAIRR